MAEALTPDEELQQACGDLAEALAAIREDEAMLREVGSRLQRRRDQLPALQRRARLLLDQTTSDTWGLDEEDTR